MFGIGERSWDRIPWDGKVLIWNKDSKELELLAHEFKD
jgi:hypothetical protein